MIDPTGHPGAPVPAAHPSPDEAPLAPAVGDLQAPWWGGSTSATQTPAPVAAAPRAPSAADGPAAPSAPSLPPAAAYEQAVGGGSGPPPFGDGGGGGDHGGDGAPGADDGGDDGPPPRPKLRLRWLRLLGLLIPIGALAIVSTVFGMMMAVSRDLPDLDTAKEFRSARNTILVDRNNKQIGILADSSRYIVTSKQIAPAMKNAVVAMEDERFWTNSGVDFRGISRALVQDIISRRAAQGASTITQQLVKLALQAENKRTVLQKLRESALAFHMTRQWSKMKILTTYLNRVYFGNGAYGVESAAKTYFGKSPDHVGCAPPKKPCAAQLRPAEAALLTAIIASPSRFDPVTEPEAALRRRNAVLLKMEQQGKIDIAEYEAARAEPLPPANQIEPPSLDAKNPYFASWVSAQLVDRFGAQRTYEGGLKVKTTIDQGIQNAAQKAVNSYLTRPDGPQASLVAIDNRTGEVRAMVGGPDYRKKPFNLATQGNRQPGSSFKPFVLAQALRDGISPDSVWSSKRLALHVRDERGRKEVFRVTNDESAYSGQSTLARALTFSDNAVYAQVGQKVGTKPIAKLIRRMGVRSPVSHNAAVVLGAPKRGVTVLDMAHAYQSFATRGLRINGSLGAPNDGPVGITRVDTGKRVMVNHVEKKRVLPTAVADETTSIMRTVVSTGTGKRAQYGGFAAGKTGTTENNADAWFVGFSKELTVAVWVGYPDSGKPMQTEYDGEPVSGGTYPAAIWGTFMGQVASILDARSPTGSRKQPKGSDVPVDEGTPTVGAAPAAPAEGDGDGATSSDGSGSSGSGSTGTGVDGGGTGSGNTTGGGGGGTGGGGGSSTPPATPVTPPATGGGSTGTGAGGSAGSGSGSGGGSGSGSGGGGSGGGGSGGAVPLG